MERSLHSAGEYGRTLATECALNIEGNSFRFVKLQERGIEEVTAAADGRVDGGMMRTSLRLTSIVAIVTGLSACVIGCGGGDGQTTETLDSEVPDTATEDTSVAEVDVDTGVDSTVEETLEETSVDSGVDTSMPETTDTGPEDTGPADTGPADTGPPDTGPEDTGPADTGPADTGPEDTGPADTGPADTGPVDTGPACIVGGNCDDGNACTVGDKYDSSCACVPGPAATCDDGKVCTTDSCNPTSGCQFVPVAASTPCGPGNKCDAAGFCESVCTSGGPCDDGSKCTTGEKFNDLCVCGGGTAVTCADDLNVCTTEACVPAVGCTSTPLADGTSCGGTKVCKATACIEPSALLPTIKITAPAALTKKGFKATGPDADVCNPLPFTLTVTAPEQIQTVSWHFFTPTTSGGMNGDTCGAPATANPPWRAGLGTPLYSFKIDETKYAGLTGGTYVEDIAVSGLYSGGLWLWCTTPGSGGTAFVTSPTGSAVPAVNGGLTPLSRYCHSTTLPADSDLAKQWTLIVQLTDKAGNKATDEIKFWVYKL